MSKALILLNMPEKCSECVASNPDGDWCPFHGEVTYLEYGSKRPDDCPIKELPDDGYYYLEGGKVHSADWIQDASYDESIDLLS